MTVAEIISLVLGGTSIVSSVAVLLYLRAILKRFDFGSNALHFAAEYVEALKADNARLRSQTPTTLQAPPT